MGQVFTRQLFTKEVLETHEPFTISTTEGTIGGDIQTPIINASSQVNALVRSIRSAVAANNQTSSTTFLFVNEVNAMKEATRAHDILFEEAEVNAQTKGKKMRRQTLQEFVLLFFFCSYLIFSAALVMSSYIEKGANDAMKTAGILLVATLVITGLIIRLA